MMFVPCQLRTQNPVQSSSTFSVVTDSLSPERFPQSQKLSELGAACAERCKGWDVATASCVGYRGEALVLIGFRVSGFRGLGV